MLGIAGNFVDRIFAVMGAFAFSQFPLFMQDYRQQLVGRIAELRLQIQAMQQAAGDRTLHAYVEKFANSSDPDFSKHGEILQGMLQRYEALQQGYASMAQAAPLVQPFTFATHFQKDVALSTWEHFDFGIPLSVEGGVYALIGIVVATCLIRIGTYPFKKMSGSDASAH